MNLQAFPGQRQINGRAVARAVQFRRQMEDGGAEKVEESEFSPLITIETGVRSGSPLWKYDADFVPSHVGSRGLGAALGKTTDRPIGVVFV